MGVRDYDKIFRHFLDIRIVTVYYYLCSKFNMLIRLLPHISKKAGVKTLVFYMLGNCYKLESKKSVQKEHLQKSKRQVKE